MVEKKKKKKKKKKRIKRYNYACVEIGVNLEFKIQYIALYMRGKQ